MSRHATALGSDWLHIDAELRELYDEDAIHVKRGFRIRHTQLRTITNHLIEEAVELQAAIEDDIGTPEQEDAVWEEAADVLLIYMHLLRKRGMGFMQVCRVAMDKLHKNWTTDPAKVTAVNPGFTRRGRKDG